MKKILISALLATSLGLGGCADVQKFETWFTSPANQQTIAILAQATVVVICDISAVASVASTVEQAAQSSASVLGTTSKVAAASSAACTGLGGIVTGSATVPAGTQVVQ